MKLYKLNQLFILITGVFLSNSVLALPEQWATGGNINYLPGGNYGDPYKNSGFQKNALWASGSGSKIIVVSKGIEAESTNFVGSGVVAAENGGAIYLGDGSIIRGDGLNPPSQFAGPVGITSDGSGSLVEAKNLQIDVSGNSVRGLYAIYGGEIALTGKTDINASNRLNTVYDATVLHAFNGGLITTEDIDITIGSSDGNYAKNVYGVISSVFNPTQVRNEVNINGHLSLDITGLNATGILVNRYEPNSISASVELESISGKIQALDDNSIAKGLDAINGDISITNSIYDLEIISKGSAYAFLSENHGNINLTADIEHISTMADLGWSIGMFASNGNINAINKANNTSVWDISSINGAAAAIYSTGNISVNQQGNYLFNVIGGGPTSFSYGISALAGSNVNFNGNTQWNITNLANESFGFSVNSSHIKQTGLTNLQVIGKKAFGIILSGDDASIELENITGKITSTDSLGEANTIYASGGSNTNPNLLNIHGNINDLVTNGTNVVTENGFLNAKLTNTTLNSTSNKGFNIHNNSIVTIDADNAYFIGDSVVDGTSQFDLSLVNKSQWDIKTDSNVTNLTNQSGSIIDLRSEDCSQYNTLTVEGNYVGGNNQPTLANPNPSGNGLLIVNTFWNNTNSLSDSMQIKGTADGYTEVKTKNGIIGDVSNNGTEKYSTDVITVDDHGVGKNAFYGFADTAGAGQAILKQRDDNHYAWYLNNSSFNPLTPIESIKPEVPAYIMTKKANMELGYTLISALHQRIGDAETMNWNKTALSDDKQTWGRFLTQYSKNQGENRFGYRSKLWGIQFGYDFYVTYNENNESRTHTGLIFTYARDNLTFSDDKFVTFDKSVGDYISGYQQTGTGYTNAFALGLNSTHYTKNGSYVDLISQIDYMRNRYHSIRADNTTNNSYGLTLSAEIGRPYTLNQNWKLEPQAQLIYQYRKFSNFSTLNDIYVNVSDHFTPSLRGRVGLRLAYNSLLENSIQPSLDTFYVTANLYNEFIYNHDYIYMGNSRVEEDFSRAQGEVGMGLQLPISASAYIYSDIRYSHSLDNNKGNKREYSGNIGVKWQL